VLRHGIGANVQLESVASALLVETPGRVLVAVDPSATEAISGLAAKFNIPLTNIGVTGGAELNINGAAISITELRAAFTETFPKLFG